MNYLLLTYYRVGTPRAGDRAAGGGTVQLSVARRPTPIQPRPYRSRAFTYYPCLPMRAYHCLLLLFTTGDHGEAAISGRLYDGVAQGALNVLLGPRILQETIAFGRELPWRNMTIVVDPVAFSARPVHAIETAVSAARARRRCVAHARAGAARTPCARRAVVPPALPRGGACAGRVRARGGAVAPRVRLGL